MWLEKLSELGLDGLKDDRIKEKGKTKILQSSNPKNLNSDNDRLKDDRITKKEKNEMLESSNPKNHNSDKKEKV